MPAATIFVIIVILTTAVVPGKIGGFSRADIVIYSLVVGIGWSLNAFVIARFGLLAIFTTWVTGGFLYISPLTASSSRFYFPSGVLACAFVLAVALYGFQTTLGSRPLRQWLQWSSGS